MKQQRNRERRAVMGSYNFDTSQITISFLQKASQEDTIEI
tara:strand:- start:11242 stop:11361 length:120 start_codon:yes stop_codon:yes gene_type:complete